MKTKIKYPFSCIAVLVFIGVGIYLLLHLFFFFYSASAQMNAGQQVMDEISEDDIPIWIERTQKYLEAFDPNTGNLMSISFYSNSVSSPIPDELKKLKIRRIDVQKDSVEYVWMGGLDHTYLSVEKTGDGRYLFTANYNDEKSKVIWPKDWNTNIEVQQTRQARR